MITRKRTYKYVVNQTAIGCVHEMFTRTPARRWYDDGNDIMKNVCVCAVYMWMDRKMRLDQRDGRCWVYDEYANAMTIEPDSTVFICCYLSTIAFVTT